MTSGEVVAVSMSAVRGWLAANPGVNPLAEDGEAVANEDVQREILATLKSIDAKLTPPQVKPAQKLRLGRVFSAGHSIPPEVDLVVAASGLRWCREFEETAAGRIPVDRWYPRDVEGPILSTGDLIAQSGHVTEVPAPESQP